MRRMRNRKREDQAVMALVALTILNDKYVITDEELEKYISKPVKLSKADAAALKRARPKLLKAIRKELKQGAKQFMETIR